MMMESAGMEVHNVGVDIDPEDFVAQVKILVGGAPVTQAFADEIGADGFAADAGSAAKLAKTFVN